MSEQYNEGDLIRATKGETRISGRLVRGTEGDGGLMLFDAGWSIRSLTEGHLGKWTIEVLERAKPQRNVGWYKDADADLWWWDGKKWKFTDAADAETYTGRLIEPIERMYTQADVMKLVKSSAYFIDPTWEYGGQAKKLISNLEVNL